MDGSPERDVIEFTATSSEGKKVTLEAVETEAHSGRFEGRVFPVAGAPERDSEIQLPEGGTITATYRDMENLDPGIPADRSVTIEHAKYGTPLLSAYTVSSKALPTPVVPKPDPKAKEKNARRRRTGPEAFFERRSLSYAHVDEAELGTTQLKGVVGATLHFDVVVPHLALAGSSEVDAYVQTEAGRQMAKVTRRRPSRLISPFRVPSS